MCRNRRSTLKNFLIGLFRDESGQDLAEYTMLIVLIAIACIGAVTALGDGVQTGLQTAADGITGGAGS